MINNNLLLAVLTEVPHAAKEKRNVICAGYTEEEINEALLYAHEKNWIEAAISKPMSGGSIVRPLRLTAAGIDHISSLQ